MVGILISYLHGWQDDNFVEWPADCQKIILKAESNPKAAFEVVLMMGSPKEPGYPVSQGLCTSPKNNMDDSCTPPQVQDQALKGL